MRSLPDVLRAASRSPRARWRLRDFTRHLGLDVLRHPEVLKDDRQRFGREALELRILARTDLPFQELRRLLVLLHLPLNVSAVELVAARLLELGGGFYREVR